MIERSLDVQLMASGELNSIVDGLFCLVSKLFYFALGFAAAVDSPFPTDY